ncbi:hypothetical protein NCAS_0G01520 [Naumovozyma castellii]|uniref:Vacuolar import/degradation Vid27 C-terminal domain-containing protein n=1 Tax=Naumovozyma castellii TaxID=27288 RepID=G0VI05_NAUCA|nr:hypothetical protein NCAS_0G01520 [Naumovozyma castellii CBS 4309]CCC71039.1 hypothetical protein NCAS_0G01520 [Naumovozyma castellii CBS 4309]
MNIVKKFMGSGTKQDLLVIPSGQFDLLRSQQSPKASLECIYNDSTLAIRETTRFAYELVVRKMSDNLETPDGEESEDYSDDSISVLSTQSKKKEDEWIFEVNDALEFHKNWNKQGDATFVWNNLQGDEDEEKVQFVMPSDVALNEIEQFLQTVHRCQFEVKYKKSSLSATASDLLQFESNSLGVSVEDNLDPDLDEKFKTMNIASNNMESEEEDDDDDAFEDANDTFRAEKKIPLESNQSAEPVNANPPSTVEHSRTPSPLAKTPAGEEQCRLKASVYVFDPIQGQFILQENGAKVALIKTGKYEYWLAIEGKQIKLGTDVSPSINPTFESLRSSFIFNYSFNNVTLSYLLKFDSLQACITFHSVWSKCFWMTLNKEPFEEIPLEEQKYVLNSGPVSIEKQLDEILALDSEDEREQYIKRHETEADLSSDEEEEEQAERSKKVISSESFEEKYHPLSGKSTDSNKSLTVAFRNDRSYVLRGNKLGVFKTDDDDDDLDFVTVIKDISTLDGGKMDPHNPMLYMEDRSLILQDSSDKKKLYKMDLERGKVVEEWGTGERDIVQYGPNKKFDQLTAEQTILGVSPNGLLKIDPRVNTADKTVLDQSKEYKTKTEFSSICTTENGSIAVGSEKGDVRLYDRLGIRAKTRVPSLGEPNKFVSASSDGKWLLVTCESSILLMDMTIKTGKNTGNLGFLKSFPSSEVVKTYILKICPEDANDIVNYTQKPISFTRAHFNIGVGKQEDTILSSTGPYAVSWSLEKILAGFRKPYKMKRYKSNIIEDNFEFGTNKKIIVALENDVSSSKTKSFKRPNKDVIMPSSSLTSFYS